MKALRLSHALFLLCNVTLFANENNASLNSYLSTYKNEAFSYDYEKNEAESSKLRDSWIAPININYSLSRSKPYEQEQQNENAAIKMDQPIFQSGGIYYGIKFANASKRYSDYSIDVAKRKMIKDTVALLMQIKQMALKEKKQLLQIENSDINLKQKQEEYLSGQLDSGFLDNAIIQKNIVTQALYDIQTAKEKLITQFHALSDLDYKTAHIPHLEFISQEDFIKHNIVLKKTDAEVAKNRYAKNVRIAKYLPRVNLTAGYNWSKSSGQQFYAGGQLFDSSNELNYYDYGLRASMPLDINTFRDIESAKVDYLKSQVVKKDKERELHALFEQVMHNIKNVDKKIALSRENIKLYTKLLRDTKELYAAGYKTEYDVNTLKNSLAIQNFDTKIYEIDKQLELLTLYEMYVNNGE
ncbi:TolC family protein [Sulfurimonas paralvinellae]|uniref:Transporter n=1 Tax=Sulfurimonas paralvinellae TaxID=317658 RepID=A0A7M1B899_9BACT|nr:TolC family protein [Sulfurimonas paralvinellae]QOP45957.1 transporter [Sulfurimonas paralvinellae]